MHIVDERAKKLLEDNGFKFNFMDGWFQVTGAPEAKPRTNVAYKHLTQSDTSVWDLKQMLDDGELFARRSDDTYDLYSGNAECYMIRHFIEYGVYRKVEKEIDWREEVKEHINKKSAYILFEGDSVELTSVMSEVDFIAMCRLVELLTRHIEV